MSAKIKIDLILNKVAKPFSILPLSIRIIYVPKHRSIVKISMFGCLRICQSAVNLLNNEDNA
jgi:hypothetical protein